MLKGPKQWFVTGGHVLAMSSAKSPRTIGLHDPANPFVDHTNQSPYAEEKYTLTPVTSTFGYKDATTGKDDHFTAVVPLGLLDPLAGDGHRLVGVEDHARRAP